jgi:hypothetical protein
MESKIIIKQVANPDNPQLSAKYVGAKEYATPKTGKDGKIITGFDENSYEILSNPDDDTKKKQSVIKKQREELERLLNVSLTTDSSFWNEFFIVLEDERTLDPLNPRDILHEKFLLANKYVAPSFEAVRTDPEYFNCLFYIYREKEETAKKAQDQRKVDKATAILSNLSEENPNKLQQVSADIFGYDAHEISPDAAYIKLKEYLEASDETLQKLNIARFLLTVQKTPEEIAIKKILDKGLKKRFVTSKGNVYRRGDLIYGNNYDEALEFLGSPENSGELISLQKQTDRA